MSMQNLAILIFYHTQMGDSHYANAMAEFIKNRSIKDAEKRGKYEFSQ